MAEIIIKKWTTASVQVVYYIPDYLNLVNEFIWQTRDQLPDYPRIERFLDYENYFEDLMQDNEFSINAMAYGIFEKYNINDF